MKKIVFLFILFFALCNKSVGQCDSLSYKNGIWKDGQKLSTEDVRSVMANNSEALKLYNSGKTLKIFYYIVGLPSAYMLGYDLGGRLAGGPGNSTMLIAGGIGTAAGLILSFAAESNSKSPYSYTTPGQKTIPFHT